MGKDPTARTLELLSLLQTHRRQRASELAERLDVTERTVRRDIDRLRELGYPVDATPGSHGGYRLAVGAHLPPLLFDDDEAVAVVVGLRAVAGAAIAGVEDTSVRALAKIEQALPDRLRRRVVALGGVASLQRRRADGAVVDPEAISVLASACRDREEVRFEYRRRDGVDSSRRVQPHELLSAGRLWYLLAWDIRRGDWRIFRVDRLDRLRRAGGRFAPREIPGGDAAAFLAASAASAPREVEALVAVGAPYEQLADALSWVDHTVVESDERSCTIRLRADEPDPLVIAACRLALRAPVRVVGPGAVADGLDGLAGRLSSPR